MTPSICALHVTAISGGRSRATLAQLLARRGVIGGHRRDDGACQMSLRVVGRDRDQPIEIRARSDEIVQRLANRRPQEQDVGRR